MHVSVSKIIILSDHVHLIVYASMIRYPSLLYLYRQFIPTKSIINQLITFLYIAYYYNTLAKNDERIIVTATNGAICDLNRRHYTVRYTHIYFHMIVFLQFMSDSTYLINIHHVFYQLLY
jgi:hypothetical protein